MSAPAEFILLIKSFEKDINRAALLLESIEKYNRDNIPVYISVPQRDLALFQAKMGAQRCHWLTDEQVFLANPCARIEDLAGVDGRLIQQVIKAEVWRVVGCKAYLAIDSDSYFIRDFYVHDFMHASGYPYTILHQNKDFMQNVLNMKQPKALENFLHESRTMKAEFQRQGPDYDFGPSPLLWAADVWRALDERHLQPKGETLLQAIIRIPSEIRWYGEALLAFQTMPIIPVAPYFRVYYYDWLYYSLRRQGETEALLTPLFMGVVQQSNWDRSLDAAAYRKPFLSRLWRKIKSLRYR